MQLKLVCSKIQCKEREVHGKNNSTEISINLVRYRSENNFIRQSK